MGLFHLATDEHSRLRRLSLYLFARYLELPALKWSYAMFRGPLRRIGGQPLVRKLLGSLLVRPFGLVGDTARPVPYPHILDLVDGLEGPMAVGPCRCRITNDACDHPLETDIVIRTGHRAWTEAFPKEYRTITPAEAKRIITACHQQGLWHMVFIHCPVNADNEYVICNCCACGCVPYILNRDLGQDVYPFLIGQYQARLHPDRCAGHGDCVRICPFGVWQLDGSRPRAAGPCFGCGLCVHACPSGAIEMVGGTHAH